MTTKQAIAGARNVAMAFDIGVPAYDEIMQVCDALVAAQKREREMFKRLSRECKGRAFAEATYCGYLPLHVCKCTRRNCPLNKESKR